MLFFPLVNIAGWGCFRWLEKPGFAIAGSLLSALDPV
jgi:hypothetical protein